MNASTLGYAAAITSTALAGPVGRMIPHRHRRRTRKPGRPAAVQRPEVTAAEPSTDHEWAAVMRGIETSLQGRQ